MSTTTELLRGLIAGGLSQSEIARRTGIPQPRLSRWAAGETPDAADDAFKLKAIAEGEGVESSPRSTGEETRADVDRRVLALKAALSVAGADRTYESVLVDAKAFLAFLGGGA